MIDGSLLDACEWDYMKAFLSPAPKFIHRTDIGPVCFDYPFSNGEIVTAMFSSSDYAFFITIHSDDDGFEY
jgi:hypothetical protein